MTRPRTFLLAAFTLAGIVVGAAFLAAPVYELLVDAGWLRPEPNEEGRAFLKVFRRLLLVPLLIALFAWLRPWRHGGMRPSAYGLRGPDARLAPAVIAFAVTVAVCLVVLWLRFEARLLWWDDPLRWDRFAGRLGRYLAVGLLIGVAEEWFFRGWIWKQLARRTTAFRAAVASAAIFAVLHAFKPGAIGSNVSRDASGAFEALGSWLARVFDVREFGPLFLGLFLFGMTLSALYLRTRTLWTAIGTHAAAIACVYSYGALTDRVSGWTLLGSKMLLDGVPGWVLLAAATYLLWPKSQGPASPADTLP